MNRTRCVLISFLLCIPGVSGLLAQEVISPLHHNPRAAQQYNNFRSAKKSATEILLELPFFDEFSNSSLIADSGLWSDAYAFVNNNFSVKPVSNGVATLDALDEVGSVYSTAVLDPNSFEADLLSSHAINLVYPASDSIYFSFLYQPGGLCDLPEEQDSLMVDFYASDSSRWINVWRIPGTGLHDFKHVMIPVTSERFLTSEFRFRFRNRASLPRNNETPDKRSNVDYWHVDYVRLDRNRFAADTILRDVACNRPITSIFKELSAVPWSHFESAYNTTLAPFVSAQYRNNDSIARNVTRALTIEEPYYDESQAIGVPTAQDIQAFEETSAEFAYTTYDLNFNRGDSALIRFKVSLRTDDFDPKVNDTVIYDQLFRDYYAYDDGTAEAGYGLRGDGTEYGMVAIKHYSYAPDLLGGVYIYFNQVNDSLNMKDYTFNLMVWNDAGGIPGTAIWDDEVVYKPEYTPTYTGFVKYEFTEPVPVNGTFYVGWRQYKPYTLNMGLDLNNTATQPMFFNMGSWLSSEAPGMVLLRPYVYDPSTGIVQPEKREIAALNFYPNPASERIYFQLPPGSGKEDIQVYFYDASGRQLHQEVLRSNVLDVSGYASGLYFIRAIITGESYYSKILIKR